MTDREIDPRSGTWSCPVCKWEIEPMEPYLILVVNNTEPPEQQTFRFDDDDCLERWLNDHTEISLQGWKARRSRR